MTIDRHIPTMPVRSTLGLHRPDRHCLHQARSACEVLGANGDLHPTENEGGGYSIPCMAVVVLP